MGNVIRVLIGDASPLFRRGTRATIEEQPDMAVVGETADDQSLLDLAVDQNPDVVIYGVTEAETRLHEMTRSLHLKLPNTGVIVLADIAHDEQLFSAVKTGASAFLLKTTDQAEFVETIRRVADGEHLIDDTLLTSPTMASKVLTEFSVLNDDTPQEIRPLFAPLSPREIEILDHICQGGSNKLIARDLDISEQTVKNHITSILKKLAVNDRTEAVIYSLRRGWISVDSLGK